MASPRKIIITQKIFCHPEEEKICTIINSIHTSPFQKVYIVDSCCYFVFTFLCKVKSLTTGGFGSNCLKYRLCIWGNNPTYKIKKNKSKKIPDLDSRFFMISEANSNHLDYLSLKYEIFEKQNPTPHISLLNYSAVSRYFKYYICLHFEYDIFHVNIFVPYIIRFISFSYSCKLKDQNNFRSKSNCCWYFHLTRR